MTTETVNTDNTTGAPGDSPVPQATATTETTTVKKTWKTAAKEFESADDLLAHTQDLERKLVETQLANANRPAPYQPTMQNPTPMTDEDKEVKELAELLFTDPEKHARRSIEIAERRQDKKINQQKTQDAFWKEFYSEHPDLQKAEPVVQLLLRGQLDRFKDLPLSEAKKQIAEETRKMLKPLVEAPGTTTTTMHRTQAATLPGTGGSTPAPAAQGEPANFLMQIKKWQSGRGRVKA